MIWNLWEMSAVLAGSRDLPDTNLMKSTRSSLENSSSVCQNHCTSWCCSSTSRYRTTFFKTSTEISGIPHTICSSCLAVRRDSSGTGTIQDIPSRTAATCSQETLFVQSACIDWAPIMHSTGLGTSCLLIRSPDPLLTPQNSRWECPWAWPTLLASDPLLEPLPAYGIQILLLISVQVQFRSSLSLPYKIPAFWASLVPTLLTHIPTHGHGLWKCARWDSSSPQQGRKLMEDMSSFYCFSYLHFYFENNYIFYKNYFSLFKKSYKRTKKEVKL